MSANSLTKHLRLGGAKKHQGKKRRNEWRYLALFPLWLIASYFISWALLFIVINLTMFFGFYPSKIAGPTVFQVIISVLTYTLTFLIAVGVPYLVLKRKIDLRTLGLQRMMSWTDIGLAPLAFILYALIVWGVTMAIVAAFPGFPADQVQDVGFKSVNSQYEFILAFLTLVVAAPIAEEVLFRGYLYGKLRIHVPVYAAAIVTSLLFALAHGQWNVAIDTFILSLVMIGLRELTGSIWAGILLHILKNMIAFYTVFVLPMLMLGV